MNREQLFWRLNGGGWAVFVALLFAFRLLFSPSVSVTGVELGNWALYGGLGAFLTYRLRLRIRDGQWLEMTLGRVWYRYGAWVVGIGLVLAVQVTLVAGGWRVITGGKAPVDYFAGIWLNATFAVAMWTGMYVTIVTVRRYSAAKTRALELELVAKEARLQSLQAQVNPHFLFNSLNTVRALIGEDPPRAMEAVTWLAGILRYSLRPEAEQCVTVAEEMEMVEQYLGLEKLRFEERLTVRVVVEEEVRRALLPRQMGQTLVENAIKHGIGRLARGGMVTVDVRRAEREVEFVVRNSGVLGEERGGAGIGLANTRERLELLYGTRGRLTLREESGEVVATVRWPLAFKEAAA